MNKGESGFVQILLILITVVLLILFLVPFPYYQKTPVRCDPNEPCPEVGWNLHVPVWKQIYRSMKGKPTNNPLINENTNITIDDWKTYYNEEYGFEFRYPEYLEVEIEGEDRFSFMLSIIPDTSETINNPIEIAMVISSDNKLLTDLLDCKKDAGTEGVGKIIENRGKEFTILNKLKTVDNVEGCMQKTTSTNNLTFNVLFTHNSDFYTIQFVGSETDSLLGSLVNRILATFRFIDNDNQLYCEKNNGMWVDKESVCENISESVCLNNEGEYDGCIYSFQCNSDKEDCPDVCTEACFFD